MSRWIDKFKNHQFQHVWKQILKLADEVSIDDATVVTNVEEIARLKKVVTFLNELLSSCDPELLPESTWDNFNSQAGACLQQINLYQGNRNIGHITNANANLDNLLTYIKPYQVTVGKVAQSSIAAFKSYSETINSSLSSFHHEAQSLLSEMHTVANQLTIKAEESYKVHTRLKELEADYFDDTNDYDSVSTRIANFESELSEAYEKINAFRAELFDGDSANEPISAEIRAALATAESESESIKTLLKEVENKIIDFKGCYTEIFGTKNQAGDFEGGLRNEINARQKQLDEFKEKQEIKYKALNEQIESLLPGATSAGLASAYLNLKKSFDKPISTYSIVFYVSIAFLIILSLISVTQEVGFWMIKFVDVSDFSKLASNVLYKLPMILPILWLAIFASKRRSEAVRLQQEYAHKEALANSYQSFKQQIKELELDQHSEELMKKLLESAIDAVSMNASNTLDKKHGDKTPVNQGVDELIGYVEKIKKIFSSS